MNKEVHILADSLYRHEAGKMVAVLVKIFGTENLQLSEDVVQETFIAAVQNWTLKGLPENPPAWLMRVAKNKTINALRRNKFSSNIDFSDPDRKLLQSEYTLSAQIEKLWKEEEIQDDLMRMMFACCHEQLSSENQITLILKTLCGFSTSEIASAFLTSEETISKRLYRTREFFRKEKIKPQFPEDNQIQERTEAVLKAIYLIFNEGYNSGKSNELIRKDLLHQAMYLCKLLCDHSQTQLPQVYAAMALMCFHASRIDSRITPEGEIILLAQQDRDKWNEELIKEGVLYLNKAAFGKTLSTYHVEAAIAYEHCVTKDYLETNWKQILDYYELLFQLYPTSVVALNRLTVVYKLKGLEVTLKELDKSPFKKEWQKNYLYYSLLGEIYAETDKSLAETNFKKAISITSAEAEIRLLNKKIADLKPISN